MRLSILPLPALLVAGMLSAIGSAKAAVDIPPRCPMPTVAALEEMSHASPDLIIFEFRGEDAKAGIRLFNALPPVGNESGDRFYIAIRPGFQLSRLLIAKQGCLRNVSLVDVRIALAIKKTIEEAAADSSI